MRSSREDELVYRRGLVMGLTMAEVLLLVVFALLLLIGFQTRRVTEGTAARAMLATLAQRLGVRQEQIPENFDRLVLATEIANEVANQSDAADGPGQLREAKALVRLGREVKKVFGANRVGQSAEQAAEEFVKASGDVFEQQGGEFGSSAMWIRDAGTAQRDSQGNGRVLPPCVTGSDGKPAYVFTARLFDGDLELEDRDLGAVKNTAAWPLFEPVTRMQRITTATFLAQTQPIFEWSKSRNCRFYTWIEDATGTSEKRLYKQRLRTVGQHFYYFEPTESVEGRLATQ